MNQFTQFTYEQFIEFVKAQPDGRPVKMEQSFMSKETSTESLNSDCGCVLVHYGQSVEPNAINYDCAFNSVCCDLSTHSHYYIGDIHVRKFISDLLSSEFVEGTALPTNYKQLKELVS